MCSAPYTINPNQEYNTVNSFLNFLKTPALIVANIHPDQKGNIHIPIPSIRNYSQVHLIVTNNDNAICEVIPLPSCPIQKRDLT